MSPDAARLATALGVTQGAVSRWANGSRTPTLNRLGQIAEVLRCSPTDLLVQASHTRPRRGAA